MQHIIRIHQGVVRHPQWRMAQPIHLSVLDGEQIAIVGPNAAGKTRLVEVLTGHYPLMPLCEAEYDFAPSPFHLVSDNIRYLSFRDSYGPSDSTYYYQQRWNQHDISASTPTAGQLLEQSFEQAAVQIGPQAQARHQALRQQLWQMFSLAELSAKYVISLSSGELRRLQLARALLAMPRVLILDNPFIGLDAPTRQLLRDLLSSLCGQMRLLLILVLSRAEDIPPCVSHVVPVEDLQVLPKVPVADYLARHAHQQWPGLPQPLRQWMLNLPQPLDEAGGFYPAEGGEILRFDGVSISYGTHTLLRQLHWTVREGERWALSGANGSGKSTLLSLVCADNPQAYACPIHLFGHRRGTGESIWQIKRHIGYVSPEMHRAYLKDIPALAIVASGLSDSVGLYFRPSPQQQELCLDWMRVFGVEHLAHTTFLRLSSGEQRLCLLARAFVKDPHLLILDEPLHGLDAAHRHRVQDIINTFCQRPRKTLVMVTHYAHELPACITHRLELKRPE